MPFTEIEDTPWATPRTSLQCQAFPFPFAVLGHPAAGLILGIRAPKAPPALRHQLGRVSPTCGGRDEEPVFASPTKWGTGSSEVEVGGVGAYSVGAVHRVDRRDLVRAEFETVEVDVLGDP